MMADDLTLPAPKSKPGNAGKPVLRPGAPRPLSFAELRRRSGEQHAAWMVRLRHAEIFTAWPAVLDGRFPVPFAIGIRHAFEARRDPARCSWRTLHRLIETLATSRLYQVALTKPGAWRYGIDGDPVEPVSPEHAKHAAEQLRERTKGPGR
jgi:hypothetical protein